MKDRDRVYLQHILDAIRQIESFSQGIITADELRDQPLHRAGIERMLTIIGEASKQVSPGLKEKHPEVPWKEISGMRDKIIHNYFGVDYEAVWLTVKTDIPDLKEKLIRIFN